MGGGHPRRWRRELDRRVGDMRSPGTAIRRAVERRRAGAPWFEAAGGSFGDAALPRAVAVGAVHAGAPDSVGLAASLDAVVSHASRRAVASAAALAGTVAALITRPDGTDAVAAGAAGGRVARQRAGARPVARSPHRWSVGRRRPAARRRRPRGSPPIRIDRGQPRRRVDDGRAPRRRRPHGRRCHRRTRWRCPRTERPARPLERRRGCRGLPGARPSHHTRP